MFVIMVTFYFHLLTYMSFGSLTAILFNSPYQIRNLRIGAMMRTILPALGQAVVLNSYSSTCCVGSSESLKSQLQVRSAYIVFFYYASHRMNVLSFFFTILLLNSLRVVSRLFIVICLFFFKNHDFLCISYHLSPSKSKSIN